MSQTAWLAAMGQVAKTRAMHELEGAVLEQLFLSSQHVVSSEHSLEPSGQTVLTFTESLTCFFSIALILLKNGIEISFPLLHLPSLTSHL